MISREQHDPCSPTHFCTDPQPQRTQGSKPTLNLSLSPPYHHPPPCSLLSYYFLEPAHQTALSTSCDSPPNFGTDPPELGTEQFMIYLRPWKSPRHVKFGVWTEGLFSPSGLYGRVVEGYLGFSV